MTLGDVQDMTLEYSLDGTNWSTSIPTAVDAGTYTVSYRMEGADAELGKVEASIAAADISGAAVSVEKQSYTGEVLTPAPVVKIGDKTLVEGTDYEVGYASNVEVGTAVVAVTGRGNYSGSATTTFAIAPQGKGMVKVIRKGGANAFDTMAAIVDEGKFPTGGTVMVARSVPVTLDVTDGWR